MAARCVVLGAGSLEVDALDSLADSSRWRIVGRLIEVRDTTARTGRPLCVARRSGVDEGAVLRVLDALGEVKLQKRRKFFSFSYQMSRGDSAP